MRRHLDEITLLSVASGRLRGKKGGQVRAHLAKCTICRRALTRYKELDGHLRELVREGAFGEVDSHSNLSSTDAFRERPRPPRSSARPHPRRSIASHALSASEKSDGVQKALLDTWHGSTSAVKSGIAAVSASSAADRFGLLYALQAIGRRIAERPSEARRFALLALQALSRWEEGKSSAEDLAVQAVPREALEAQAHFLAAQSGVWTRNLAAARRHQIGAYRRFGRLGDEVGLALVELNESQRRVFSGDAEAALELARRSRSTFVSCALEDLAARSLVAEGLALYRLDKAEEALLPLRASLPAFERAGLWTNYVAALNEIGSALLRLGRVDAARREYARALARFDRVKDRALLGYLRSGLAEVLFRAGRYRQAAHAASRAAAQFAESGLARSALTTTLLEVESWARAGLVDRARQRLSQILEGFRKLRRPDPSLTRELLEALAGRNPDFERLARLRDRAIELLAASRA